jgi:CheY-like chemotaxis protein
MKTILIVEDDAVVLHYVKASLAWQADLRVLGAANGQEALDLLERIATDAVVTDLQMPVMDGFQLIAEASCRFPGLPVLVLTAIPKDHLPRTLAEGSLRILSKPVDPELLANELRAATAASPAGMVRGIGLGNLLQLLHWERKDCTLTIRAAGRVGHIYLKAGSLIHAATDGLEGPEAVYAICAWSEAQVEFVDACRVAPSFRLPTDELLMELALRQDHERQDAPSGPLSAVGP